jgi:hypothetical protein
MPESKDPAKERHPDVSATANDGPTSDTNNDNVATSEEDGGGGHDQLR